MNRIVKLSVFLLPTIFILAIASYLLMCPSSMILIQSFMGQYDGADIENAQVMSGDLYQFEYPGNWVLDTEDKNYIEGKFFTLKTAAQGRLIVRIFSSDKDPEDIVDIFLPGFEEIMVVESEKTFLNWGSHLCSGLEMAGRVGWKDCRIRILGLGFEDVTFAIVEFRFVDSEAMDSAGYDLISSTFRNVEAP